MRPPKNPLNGKIILKAPLSQLNIFEYHMVVLTESRISDATYIES